MFDEKLVKQTDAHEETNRRDGSAVPRRAAAEYLGRSRALRIAEQYRSMPGAPDCGRLR